MPSVLGASQTGGAREALGITEALDNALEHSWDELELQTECRTDDGLASVTVFANGVGVWNRRKQIRLTPEEMRLLLRALRDAEFGAMEDSYGGKRDPAVVKKQSPRITCWVGLEIDGASKRVAQLDGGRQSAKLKALALRIIDIVSGPAASGIAVDSLNDGFIKLAEGELASEVFGARLSRRTRTGFSGEEIDS